LSSSTRLNLEAVFEKGFRPYILSQYSPRTLRDWNPRQLTVTFPELKVNLATEQITFDVYDNGDIKSIRIIGNRKSPKPIAEILKTADAILSAIGEDADAVIENWHKRFEKHGRLMFAGAGTQWKEGNRVFLEILPAGTPKDHANLSLVFEWDYRGKGASRGYSNEVVTAPDGYDWDVSFERWQEHNRKCELEKLAEQDGADQPATAPESKPEGDEEPQPESKGRSQ